MRRLRTAVVSSACLVATLTLCSAAIAARPRRPQPSPQQPKNTPSPKGGTNPAPQPLTPAEGPLASAGDTPAPSGPGLVAPSPPSSATVASQAPAPAAPTTSPATAAQPSVTASSSEPSAPRRDAPDASHALGPRADAIGVSLGLPAGGGPTVGISYGAMPKISLRLDVGLDIHKAAATTPGTESGLLFGFSIDAGVRLYMWQSGPLHAFVQPGVFLAKQAASGDFGALTTVAAVGGLGAEYFFVPQLSVSGATGVSLKLSNDFEDIRFTTGTTALYANFYW